MPSIPANRTTSQPDLNWIEELHRTLLNPENQLDEQVLTPHDVFLLVAPSLFVGLPAEELGSTVSRKLNLSRRYYARESTPPPFDELLAPLVTNGLVEVRRRISGVRVMLFITAKGSQYVQAFPTMAST